MKAHAPYHRYLAVLSLVALALAGCGSMGEPQYSGCPSGSTLANASDTITVPGDVTWSWDPLPFPGLPAGALPTFPMTIVVKDSSGAPRNGICLSLTTDGNWWTDNSYTVPLIGTGATNRITVKTDNNGAAVVYWSTFSIPASAPAPSATAAGGNYKDSSEIAVLSGAVGNEFSATLDVTGCKANTFGVVGLGACP